MKAGTVLVVEDAEDTRNLVVKFLKMNGHTSSEAGTVDEAIKALDQKPCAIVLDLTLPDGLGDEVAMEAKKRGLDCKIFVVTAMEKFRPFQGWKPDAILQKPIDPDDLMKLVEDCKSGRNPTS